MIYIVPNKINDHAVYSLFDKFLNEFQGSKTIVKCGGVERHCEQNPFGKRHVCRKCSALVDSLNNSSSHSVVVLTHSDPDDSVSVFYDNVRQSYVSDPLAFANNLNLQLSSGINDEIAMKFLFISCVGVFAQSLKIYSIDHFSKQMLVALRNLSLASFRNFLRFKDLLSDSSQRVREGFCFNGRFPTSLAFVLASRCTGVSVSGLEIFGRKFLYIADNSIAHDPRLIFKKFFIAYSRLKNDVVEKIASDYFSERFGWADSLGTEPNFLVNQDEQFDGFNLDQNSLKIAVFPSSEHEYNFLPFGYKPIDQLGAIHELACGLEGQFTSGCEIIIRLHPNMEGVCPDPMNRIRSLFGVLSRVGDVRIKVAGPTDKLSTLRVMREADIVVSFASFTAVESAFLRKAVVQIGDSRYRFFGVAYQCPTGLVAAELIKKSGGRLKPKTNARRGALIWAVGFSSGDPRLSNFKKPLHLDDPNFLYQVIGYFRYLFIRLARQSGV